MSLHILDSVEMSRRRVLRPQTDPDPQVVVKGQEQTEGPDDEGEGHGGQVHQQVGRRGRQQGRRRDIQEGEVEQGVEETHDRRLDNNTILS